MGQVKVCAKASGVKAQWWIWVMSEQAHAAKRFNISKRL
jgi:hypothetical protein